MLDEIGPDDGTVFSSQTTRHANLNRYPARAHLLNLLINGATGITAVGMATNIPPHNSPKFRTVRHQQAARY